ncbi:MAG: tetratricopeptide repeat protein [Desulfobacterales bacterium]|jgi:tetratricopeptide (TPR) repeat protein|nr:tetratricopeptide repeat protein [Desulfobacterales bacterium]
MAEDKTRKELLEEPDPFLVFIGRALELVKKHQQQIIMAAMAVFIAVVAGSGMVYYQRHQEEKGAEMLGKAISNYNSLMRKDPQMISYQEPSAEDYDKSKKAFQEVMDQYGSTGAGKAALLNYADLCFRSKQYDDAIKSYEKALDAFGDQAAFKNLILNGLAYAFEAKEDPENAAKYFNMIVSDEGAAMKDQALFNLGRMYEKLGKTDQQIEVYKRIVAEYPDSMYFQMAKEKIAG